MQHGVSFLGVWRLCLPRWESPLRPFKAHESQDRVLALLQDLSPGEWSSGLSFPFPLSVDIFRGSWFHYPSSVSSRTQKKLVLPRLAVLDFGGSLPF